MPSQTSNVEACLPAALRGPSTSITPVAAGLSRADVYRVDAAGQTFILKVAGEREPIDAWRRKLHIQQLAAGAGLAPRITHADEARRAIVSEFIVDRSFIALYANPATREAAIALLGRTIRRLHDLPLPSDAEGKAAREFLTVIWSGLAGNFAVPAFASDTVQRMLAEEPPASGRAPVLSHNDVNPTNLVYDGERLVLFDWETAAPNDPYYDLATASVFLRMDQATCRRLLAVYDGGPIPSLPARFTYDRRLAAVLFGTMFLHLARSSGHAGATGAETADSTPSLGECYRQMQTGAVNIAAADGQWVFGLALIKERLGASP